MGVDFKFRCYGNQNQNNCLLLKKTKGLLFKQKCFSKNYLSNTVKLLLQVVSFFEEKLVICLLL